MTTEEEIPTVADVYRDRAAQFQEKATQVGNSEAAQRAEELYWKEGWHVWVSDGCDASVYPRAVQKTPDFPEGKERDPKALLDREGMKVVHYLRVLTEHFSDGPHAEGRLRPKRL